MTRHRPRARALVLTARETLEWRRPLWVLLLLALLAALASGAEVTAVTPAQGAIGTLITIDGSGFGSGEPAVRLFSDAVEKKAKLSVESYGKTQIVVSVKKGLEGVYDLIVEPDGGGEIVAPAAFEIRPPDVTAISPAQAAAGQPVTVSGSFFGTRTGKIELGCGKAVIGSWADDQVVFSVPSTTGVGLHNVTVRNKSGQVTVAGGLEVTGSGAPCNEAPATIPAVVAAMDALLADPGSPAAEVGALADEVVTAYWEGVDPVSTHRNLLASALATLSSVADIQADATASQNAPQFVSLPPFPPAVGEDTSTLIIYVNGLHTPVELACFSAGQLMKAVYDADPVNAKKFEFEVFYNKSAVQGDAAELPVVRGHLPLGVLVERDAGNDLLLLGADAVSPHAAGALASFYDTYTAGCGAVGECRTRHETLLEFAADLQGAQVSPTQVDLLAQEVTGAVVAGRNVLLVAHSQGNDLVEQTLELVGFETPAVMDHVGVVGLGSPTRFQGVKQQVGWMKRKSVQRDVVLSIPGAASAGLKNDLAKKTVNPAAIHSIDRSYLAFEESAAKIVKIIRKVACASLAPSLAGEWEGIYDVDYNGGIFCTGSDRENMTMDLSVDGADVEGDGALEDMTIMMPGSCTKIATYTRHMDVEGEVQMGKNPGEWEFSGTLTYTCPLTGMKYHIDFEATVTGNTMTGTLDGDGGDLTGTFEVEKVAD